MKKKVWFDWGRGDKLPFWMHNQKPDYEEGVGGVTEIMESDNTVVMTFASEGGQYNGYIKVTGIPFLIIFE